MDVRVGSGLSQLDDGRAAAQAAVRAALEPLRGASPDLVLLFVSPQFVGEIRGIVDAITGEIDEAVLLGCTAGGVIAAGTEIEDAPGIAVWAASFPGGRVAPFRLTFRRDGQHGVIDGMDDLTVSDEPTVLLLADPFSFPADLLIEHLNATASGVPVVGGIASGALEAGQNRLFSGGRILTDGAVGAVLTGIPSRTLVSQGCRPIGETFAVTRADRNVIQELGGEPALKRLEALYESANDRDRLLLRRGLQVGQAITELKPELRRGDFVIRGVVGIDRETGAVAISDTVEVGQTIQFQVRDAESAREDLRELLAAVPAGDLAGALLFSCNGRGQGLFGQPNHDVGALRRALGDLPIAGFFAAGEVGPVGGRNFLHSFTASVLLLGSTPAGSSGGEAIAHPARPERPRP